MAFLQVRNSLLQQISSSIQELAASTGAETERLMESRRGDIEVVAQSPILISPESTSEQKTAFLRSIQDAYGIYNSLYVIDSRGNTIASTDRTVGDHLRQIWFQKAIQEEFYVSDVYFLNSVQDFVVTFSAPVYSIDDELIGVVAGHMEADTLNALVAARRLGKTGEFVLINNEGRVVAAHDKEEIFDDASELTSVHAALNGQRGTMGEVSLHGEEALIGYVPLTGTQNWAVIGTLPMTEVNAPVNALAARMALIASLATGIIVAVVFIITRRIVQPIGELAAAAKEIGTGRYATRAEIQSQDEIGYLANAFNLMAASIQQQTDELSRSNAELEQFAAVASHDLQEPLRKIRAFGDRLMHNYTAALDEKGQDYIERMQNAAARMQELIEDLLDLSRVTSKAQPFEPTNLGALAQEVVDDLQIRIEESGARVEIGNLPTLYADNLQMRLLLQNLVSNALKFHREAETPVVTINSRRLNSRFWEITIEDNGIGFDEKYLDRIFKPFQRLHGRGVYAGSGIGLAICDKIVARHSGEITARSIEGTGTTFVVRLPATQQVKETEPSS